MCVIQDESESGMVRAGILHFGEKMTGGMGRASGFSGTLGCHSEALYKQGSTETGVSLINLYQFCESLWICKLPKREGKTTKNNN